jgi:TolA-binding protein
VLIVTAISTLGFLAFSHNLLTRYQHNIQRITKQLEDQRLQQNKDAAQRLQDLEKQTQEQKQKIDDLQIQLQTRKAQQAVLASVQRPVAHAAPLSDVVAGCGDNSYANYIYMHESGCRTRNPNSEGCDGIGQACPASKVLNPCGYDYACQNAWFSNYAKKYCYLGTGDNCWQGSYIFWLQHRWW